MTARRPKTAPKARVSDACAAAVTAELTRLVLGDRGAARPELQHTIPAAPSTPTSARHHAPRETA